MKKDRKRTTRDEGRMTGDEGRELDIPLRRPEPNPRECRRLPTPVFRGLAPLAGHPDFAETAMCVRTASICPVVGKAASPVVRLPPFPPTAAQRYNTLDLAGKVVCHETTGFFGFFRPRERCPLWNPRPTGASRPYWKPRAAGLPAPLDTPPLFRKNGSVLPQLQNRLLPQKRKTGERSILSKLEHSSVFMRCGAGVLFWIL